MEQSRRAARAWGAFPEAPEGIRGVVGAGGGSGGGRAGLVTGHSPPGPRSRFRNRDPDFRQTEKKTGPEQKNGT